MGVRIAVAVLATFATAWIWIAIKLSGGDAALTLIAIAISGALLVRGWRAPPLELAGGSSPGRVVGLWSGVEVAGLLVAANALQHFGRNDLIFPVAAVIVGLHFLPIARGVRLPLYYATGAGFILAGLIALLSPVSLRPLIVGLSAGLVLWVTAFVLGSGPRRSAVAPAVHGSETAGASSAWTNERTR